MPDSEQQALAKGRVISIDALRGFAMFWIIGGGAVFRNVANVWTNPLTETIRQQLTHLNWGGFHFWDLIFPLFLFIVGLVLPLSVSRRLDCGQSRGRLYLHITKRTVLLIIMGLIMDGLLRFEWSEMHWFGVLSLIGMSYFVAAIIVLKTRTKVQAIVITAGLLLGYWAALKLIGIQIPKDRNALPFTSFLYFAFACTGAANVLIGVLAGYWLHSNQSAGRKTMGLAAAGLASLIVGYGWGVFFPIIRVLWTSPYVLVACGYSLLLLAVFYWIIDVKGYTKWAFFFVVIGMNPITIYFLQSFVDFNEIASFFVQGFTERVDALKQIVLPFGALTVKWLFLWFLYRHKIFFKV